MIRDLSLLSYALGCGEKRRSQLKGQLRDWIVGRKTSAYQQRLVDPNRPWPMLEGSLFFLVQATST